MLVTFAKADTIGPVLILFACLAAVIIAIAPVLILAAAAEPTKKPARRQPQRAAIRAGTSVQSRGSIALR